MLAQSDPIKRWTLYHEKNSLVYANADQFWSTHLSHITMQPVLKGMFHKRQIILKYVKITYVSFMFILVYIQINSYLKYYSIFRGWLALLS